MCFQFRPFGVIDQAYAGSTVGFPKVDKGCEKRFYLPQSIIEGPSASDKKSLRRERASLVNNDMGPNLDEAELAHKQKCQMRSCFGGMDLCLNSSFDRLGYASSISLEERNSLSAVTTSRL